MRLRQRKKSTGSSRSHGGSSNPPQWSRVLCSVRGRL